MQMDPLKALNPQQRQAVTAPLGAVLVLAGPGSGKTRVLAHRIAYLVSHHGVRPEDIMAVTFTNRAAREMGARVRSLLGESKNSAMGVILGTFHAQCARLLRREAERLPVTRSFAIFDDSDQRSLVHQALKELNLDPKQVQPGKVHAAISSAKGELIEAEDFAPSTYFAEIARRVYARYQQMLLANNAFDFDDLLFWAVRLLRQHEDLRQRYRRRYPHLLVDEFQDTNTAQYALLRLLAGEKPDLFAVGDADQSIYRWRGADYRNVQRFQQDYAQAQLILLEQNYRSTQVILDAAMAVIDRLPHRKKKRLFTERGRGELIVVHESYDEADEAQFVVDKIAELALQKVSEPGECAIMYRTNAQSRALEEAFLRAGLPYRLVGAQRFYGRREVRDLIAYLRLIHNPADQVSLLRVLNTPPRGVGAKTVETLLQVTSEAGTSPGEAILDMAKEAESQFAPAFRARALAALAGFGGLLHRWIEEQDTLSLADLIDRVLEDVGYRGYIEDGTEEGKDRWDNVMELRGLADELGQMDLTTFLEHVALVSDQDTLTEAQNAPVLLTLHAAKGLEFKVVFIVGLDEEVLPHQRSFDDVEAMEEERRLFYVGITRCKDRLFLVRSLRRRLSGIASVCDPSRFLMDLPAELLEGDLVRGITAAQALYSRQTTWKRDYAEPVQARYRAGMRVRHATFGEGVVLETKVDRGDEEVTVVFEGQGIKRLVASLAGLEVLDDES
jgi:DNA helicase-2/ATP-dependent DNA helicase PcrA